MRDSLFLDRNKRVKWYKVTIVEFINGLPCLKGLDGKLIANSNSFNERHWDMIARDEIKEGQRVLVLIDNRSMIGNKLNSSFGKPLRRDDGTVTLREYKDNYKNLL
jgi:hypothetical protein